MLIEMALGGMPLTQTVEGRQRFSVSMRLAQDFRKDISEIKRTPIQTAGYGVVPLSSVADIEINEGPPMINSENAMLRGTVLFNVRGRDMGSVVSDAKKKIEEIKLNENKPDYFVRVTVNGGGCSGLSYKMDFDNEIKPDDQQFEDKGVKLVTDLRSFLYVCNTTLDFSDGLNGKGFEFKNPNASRTCACGESFAV